MPIDNDLKSTINYYIATGMPENEIISKMIASPRYSDLSLTVDYYLKQKLSPAQILQKMQSAPISGATTAQTEETPSYIQPHHGETQIGTPKVPEWKQTAMKAVNRLPEVGEAVGTAGGMAAAATNPSAALAIPATAALGRMTGRLAQTPLTQLLLPQAGAIMPSASEMASTGLQGAKGGMINAALGALTPKVLAPGEAEAIKTPETSATGRARDYFTRLLVKPSLKNPEEARQAVRTIGEQGFNIAGGEAPGQIANKIRSLSGLVDEHIANAQAAGQMVNTANIKEPLYAIRDQYVQAGLAKEAAAASRQIKAFEALPDVITPGKAQEIKKLIYSNIAENKWGQYNAPPVTKVQKSFSTGIAKNLEEVSTGDLAKVNQELGKLIQARPYATVGAEKAQEAGITKQFGNRVHQTAAKLMNRINQELANRPDYVPNQASTGSPYENLEKMFGMGYGGPKSGINVPQSYYAESPESEIGLGNEGAEFKNSLNKYLEGKPVQKLFNTSRSKGK